MKFSTVFYLSASLCLPISYVVSERSTKTAKLVWIILLWSWFLGLPFWGASSNQDALPTHTFGTMMTAVLAFIFPLKVTQMILFANGTKHVKAVEKEDDDKHQKYTRSLLSFQNGIQFCIRCLYYGFPIKSVQNSNKKSSIHVVQEIAILCCCAVTKIFLSQILTQVLVKVLEQHPDPSSRGIVAYMEILVLFTFVLISASYITDMQGAIVQLITFGRYEILTAHRYPFVSKSIRELWGHRYNIWITTLLRETVYGPCQSFAGLGQDESAFAVFVVSGILHSYVAHFTFGYGVVRSFIFFVLQALWMVTAEPTMKHWNSTLRRIITLMFFYATLPLYGGLFVEAMPDWFYRNYQDPPLQHVVRLVDSLLSGPPLHLPSSDDTKQLAEAWMASH